MELPVCDHGGESLALDRRGLDLQRCRGQHGLYSQAARLTHLDAVQHRRVAIDEGEKSARRGRGGRNGSETDKM